MRRTSAKRAALRTMEGNAFEICDRQSVVGLIFIVLRRSRTEDVVDITRGVLKLDIRDGESPDIASRAGEWNPRRRMDFTTLVDHLGHRRGSQIVGPIGEGAGKIGAAAVEVENGVANGNAHFLAIDTGERG
jgi:hypothetical protein